MVALGWCTEAKVSSDSAVTIFRIAGGWMPYVSMRYGFISAARLWLKEV